MNDRDKAAELRKLAHDVRNALNGVALNLEVARSRAQRGVEVIEVASFMETAAQQLEVATRLHKEFTDAVTDLLVSAGSGQDVRPAVTAANDTPSHL